MTAERNTESAGWSDAFKDALDLGDLATFVERQTDYSADYDPEAQGYPLKPLFEEPLLDFRVENHPVRVALAHAQYMRALAAAAGQSVIEAQSAVVWQRAQAEELAEMKASLKALTDVVADALPRLAVSAAESVKAAVEVSSALSSVADHLHRADERANARLAVERVQPEGDLPGWLRWLVRVFRSRSTAAVAQ